MSTQTSQLTTRFTLGRILTHHINIYRFQIQKVFRGHWCRQYTHSMATRKEYLDRIADISDRTTT